MKIGFRIPGNVGKLPAQELAQWAKSAGFGGMDLGGPNAERIEAAKSAGLEIGTIDLGGTQKLLSPDEAVRKEGIEACFANLHAIAGAGATRAFCVFFPADANQSRRVSLENWKAAFPAVAAEAEKAGVRIAVEGWPGPNDSALGVTPETLREMFAAVPSENFGINFDPSHLVRVGVDYQRFLNEFAGRVIHAHGKDTALDAEGAYLYGNIGPTLAKSVGFGSGDWRYCIPGEGFVDWGWVCGRLHRAGYDGHVSVELEDFRYNGSEEGEKKGLARAAAHLAQFV